MKKNYTINISISARTFWTIFIPLSILIFVGGSISGIVIVDRAIIPNLPGISDRDIIQVPDIEGSTKKDARQALYDIHLRLQVKDRVYSDTLERDIIVSQSPLPHKKVKKGRHIYVVLSKGPENSKIPNIRELPERQGKNLIWESGFANIKVCKVYSELISKDLIIKSIPEEGTLISREVPVEIIVSKGPRPTHAVVPNVIGEVLSEAKEIIKESGLLLGTIEYNINLNLKPGTIITQSISPGTNAPLNSKVNLIVTARK